MVYAQSLIVFPFETSAAFCALQSRPHELWARFFGSLLKDDLRYTPSDCFETFPFPDSWESHPDLEAAGKTYYEFRAALMVRNDEGLTKTYNRFHNPDERHPDILKLRELHADMDRAVLDATAGATSRPTASSSSTTRSKRGSGVTRRSRTATAGLKRSATKSLRASWSLMPSVPGRRPDLAFPPARSRGRIGRPFAHAKTRGPRTSSHD